MILYLNLCSPHHQSNGLEKMLFKRMPGFSESLNCLEELQERIRSAIHDIDIVLIHVCDDSPVTQLLSFRNELRDLNVVLVLHKVTSDKYIEQLLSLYPRYMTFEPEYETILSVLENRIKFKQEAKTYKTASTRK